jgi:flavin-dependent thymidylate synthase
MTGEIQRWSDVAMFEAEPDVLAADGEDVRPQVTLISMTPNPLRVMAAASEMYRGKPVRDPVRISRTKAEEWFTEMSRTKLHAPLEFIDMHFLIEGVTRAFTHQLVRQRTAVYVQESMRFAVKTQAALEVAYPPSLAGLPVDHPWRKIWDEAVYRAHANYNALVDSGMPAEDARGLLPTNITTRVHYKTNLRNLAEHAGLRLCSQAQFEWKQVWAEMLNAIRGYGPSHESWQQEMIFSLFRPICYQTGKCEFMGDNDRFCTIRERVQVHYAKGESPDTWTDIDPREPLVYGAARMRPGGKGD